MESFWEEVKCRVKESVPDHCYRMWIDPVNLIEHSNSHIKLSGPNPYCVKRLKDNYLPILKETFTRLGHRDLKIEFMVASSKNLKTRTKPSVSQKTGAFPAVAAAAGPTHQMELPGLGVKFKNGRMLKKGFTFDDFVVGKNSDFAYSASLCLAQGRINGSSILYLLAKTGLGKSHLSQAVGHHILTNSQSKRVYYITAEDFTNEMIFSLRNKSIERFKEKYRKNCDVLILEDVHFLSGKDATQKELAITLDYLLEADKKIIFSGCDLPDDIPKMNDQLKSRLTLGLVTEIDTPDYDTRVRILKKKSKMYGYTIPAPVTEYIAQELCDDVRQLESGLIGVAARGTLMGCNIDIELAKSVLANIARTKQSITLEAIKKLVCKEFSISETEIVSASRKQKIVKPRQMAIYLSKKYTDHSIKKIGARFNKYHATAIYAINAVEKALRQKSILFEQVNYLSKKIETGKF